MYECVCVFAQMYVSVQLVCVFASTCDMFKCVMAYVYLVCVCVLWVFREDWEDVCACEHVHVHVEGAGTGVWRPTGHGGETCPPPSQDEHEDLSETW